MIIDTTNLAQMGDLLKHFKPVVFESLDDIDTTLAKYNIKNYDWMCWAVKIQYISGTIYKDGHKLFYFKKKFTEQDIKDLIVNNYSLSHGSENVYIGHNHNTGVLFIFENDVEG